MKTKWSILAALTVVFVLLAYYFGSNSSRKITERVWTIRELADSPRVRAFQTNEFLALTSHEECQNIADLYVAKLNSQTPDTLQCADLLAKVLWLGAHPSISAMTNLFPAKIRNNEFGPNTDTFYSYWSDKLKRRPTTFFDRLQFVLDVREQKYGSNGPTSISSIAITPLVIGSVTTNQPQNYYSSTFAKFHVGVSTLGVSDAVIANDHPDYKVTVNPIQIAIFCTTVKYNDTELASPIMIAFYRSELHRQWLPYFIQAADSKYLSLM